MHYAHVGSYIVFIFLTSLFIETYLHWQEYVENASQLKLVNESRDQTYHC